MPEFELRYVVRRGIYPDYEIEVARSRARDLAKAVQEAASKVFFGWNVIWEIRPFGEREGQPDFSVTGWITEREGVTLELVSQAQEAVLAVMQEHAFEEERVSCWWQMVQGKWGEAQGKKQETQKSFFP